MAQFDDRHKIEKTLQNRLRGPFHKFDDPNRHFAEHRSHFRKKLEMQSNNTRNSPRK